MRVPKSRTAKSARNVAVSILTQVVITVLGFVTRTVFISQLGVAMVGVNTVLTSTLALFALADLGMSSAIMYALYKPLRDGDTKMISSIVSYAARMFRWVALVVAVAGLAFLPFVKNLVNLEEQVAHLHLYYLVLLGNSVVGYLMMNRLVLLNADQKIYLTKVYSLIFNVLRSGAQIASLLYFGNFLAYLIIQVVFTVANNLFVYLRAGRIYPFLRERSPELDVHERKSIWQSTRAALIYRAGGLAMNNSTPILISTLVGTLALGYYSNYLLVTGAALMVVETAFVAVTPSVGNLVAAKNRRANRSAFDELVLVSTLVHGLTALGLLLLMDNAIVLWLGRDYILPTEVTVAIAVNFYIVGTLRPVTAFREATGLFRKTRFIILFTAALNISLAFALAPAFGLAGVVWAPIIARLATNVWYEPLMLFRHHLDKKLLPYLGFHSAVFLVWVVIVIVVAIFAQFWSGHTLASLLVNSMLLIVIFVLVSWLVFRRTDAYGSLSKRLRGLRSS